MVRAENLGFCYPGTTFRLHVPLLEVAAGEAVAVVGPSGSGKTTLLNLVAGIVLPQTGRVRVAGAELSAMTEKERRDFRARRIGFIFQDFALLDYLPARENIVYPYRITGGLQFDRGVRDRAEVIAGACGLAGMLDRHPTALSRGEQQRVAICRALVTQPALVLADEATGNLDPDNKTLILDLLLKRTAEVDAGLLAVTHDHDLLPRFDRVVDFAAFGQSAVA